METEMKINTLIIPKEVCEQRHAMTLDGNASFGKAIWRIDYKMERT